MRKNYAITIAFALSILFNLNAKAQSWTVGNPVDMSISYLTKYAFSCAPGQADFNMNIILLGVSGIQYVAIVDSVQDIAVIFNTKKAVPANKTFFFRPSKIGIHFLEPVSPAGKTADQLKEEVFRITRDHYLAGINQ